MVLVDGEPPVLAENKLPMQPAFIGGQYPETKGWFARILYGKYLSRSRNLALTLMSSR